MRNDEITQDIVLPTKEQSILIDIYRASDQIVSRLKSLGDLECENISDELRERVMAPIERNIKNIKELIGK